MNNIIEIKNLSKKYYNKLQEILAIDDISLDVKEGEFLAIVGPSGCGKSTLLNIIYVPYSACISISFHIIS